MLSLAIDGENEISFQTTLGHKSTRQSDAAEKGFRR